ncbi:hypothetical protein [Streptomyces sp. NPDC051776]|uniref:hypothetical protein n=1 Tax=Streptomyces sp. NPDC051776 TaxID=3155414 RepID=UPI00344A2A04
MAYVAHGTKERSAQIRWRCGRPAAIIGGMFRHAFLALPSAVADAPKAALASSATTPSAITLFASRALATAAVAAVAACAAADCAVAAATAAAAVGVNAVVPAPLGGARS